MIKIVDNKKGGITPFSKINKRLFLINTFVLILLNIQAQQKFSGIVNYESSFSKKEIDSYLKKDRDSLKKIDKSFVKTLDKIYLQNSVVTSTLKFFDNEGFFKVDERLHNEAEGKIAMELSIIASGGEKEYYYNVKTNNYLIKECNTLGECFIFPNKYLKWEITKESKQIGSYVCYKATRDKGKVEV